MIDFSLKYNHLQLVKDELHNCDDFFKANIILKKLSGVNDFFISQESYLSFQKWIFANPLKVRDSDRREYGDFQTPNVLTDKICSFLKNDELNPDIIIEPTFGKGSFILSSLKAFKSIKFIFGIEIYEKYVWESKLRLLEYFLDNPESVKPEIYLYYQDIFTFDFNKIKQKIDGQVLIIGNPPWVTNSELSSLNSANIPRKSNQKNHKGIDAITGKGNFDIGEFISLLMLKNFGKINGGMAFLIKNSVIKNLVQDLHKFNFNIANIKSFTIDTNKYFGASVVSSLFTCNLNQTDENIICENYNFANSQSLKNKFGWYNDKFIYDLDKYVNNYEYDGHSFFEWRQGVKHDSSKIFELLKVNGKYRNGYEEEFELEDDIIFRLLKSSDLKNNFLSDSRKYVIITQHFIGEDTYYIRDNYPKLHKYLTQYEIQINKRKSSIYKNKPKFSIFGIGDYSFKPYKIAISGLYKKPYFSLVFPDEKNKPIMLDDTCYFLSFDSPEDAILTWSILSNEKVFSLLSSISFIDSKRPYTKDILMRIDIEKLSYGISFDYIFGRIKELNNIFTENISYQSWELYRDSFKSSKVANGQLSLF